MAETKSFKLKKESIGGVSSATLEQSRLHSKATRSILNSLKNGSKIIPEIAKDLELSKEKVFWYLMSLRKYGLLKEVGERDEFVEYTINEDK